MGQTRLTQLRAFALGPHEAGAGALAQPHALLLGQDGNDGILENAGAVEVLLGVGLVAHAVALHRVQVLERRQRPLAAEAVEAPEQHQVKLALVGIGKELLELLTVGRVAGLLLGILLIDSPAVGLGITAQVGQLVVLVCGRNAGVDGYSHY